MKAHNAYRMGALIASILLVLALGSWPYGYYQLLRLVVCGSAGFGAYLTFHSDKTPWMWILGAVALLFNPIFPIYLDRGTWQIIDLITAGLFVVSLRHISAKPE